MEVQSAYREVSSVFGRVSQSNNPEASSCFIRLSYTPVQED